MFRKIIELIVALLAIADNSADQMRERLIVRTRICLLLCIFILMFSHEGMLKAVWKIVDYGVSDKFGQYSSSGLQQ